MTWQKHGARALLALLTAVPVAVATGQATRPADPGPGTAKPSATRPAAGKADEPASRKQGRRKGRKARKVWSIPGDDLVPYPEGFDVTGSDPRALALMTSCQDTMGSLATWNRIPAIEFSFVVERDGQVLGKRHHRWDRGRGRHRVEMKGRDGASLVVAQDLRTRTGSATVEGKPATGDALADALEQAYGAWVNDSYWLIMPFKAFDAGVTLQYSGSRKRGEKIYHLVNLTFADVGLTPGDTYWAWINDTERTLDYWSYRLQGTPANKPETVFAWEEWQQFGDLRLSLSRRQLDGSGAPLMIRFEGIRLPAQLTETATGLKGS